jgi:hypothetical protein
MSWTNQSKNSSSFSNSTNSNSTKHTDEIIYFVAENGDFYGIGSEEDLLLVTQDEVNWNNQSKNSGSWNNQSKS